MADTLQTTPQAPPAADRLEAPPAARRFRWLTDGWLATLFVSPALAILIFLSIGPLIWLILLSFTDYSATRDVGYNWIGFENYTDVLTSPVVRERAITTVLFVGGAIILQTTLGFAIAYLISRRVRGRGALTTLFLIPMMLSPIVVGLFWKFMLDTQFGVVNSFLNSLGLGRVEWLTQQRLALLSLIIVDTWQWTPFIMLIALAGLTAVPKYLYEAAEIDRASEWFKFRRITLPLVWPLVLIAVMFRAIEAFRLFDLVYILTQGGPGGTTETLSFNVYKVAFFNFDTGRSAAYGILMVIVVIIAAQFYLRYLNRLQER
ncbi:MAG TPA: sugar ABC transporter permease [Solirubrobacter sp.]|jgi:multiple sugar transport system permease protein|nr:sugar ABC transporter permease [Solirubrobacter sp.]